MGAAPSQREILEELRRRVRRIERRPARREGFLATGLPEVDALLPGGGFPRGALADAQRALALAPAADPLRVRVQMLIETLQSRF